MGSFDRVVMGSLSIKHLPKLVDGLLAALQRAEEFGLAEAAAEAGSGLTGSTGIGEDASNSSTHLTSRQFDPRHRRESNGVGGRQTLARHF
jgi:hypothetical protein